MARSRQVARSSAAEYAGKCNAPGCTKVTKCHLLKATRCAPLQASSRRPMCNYMFLFSFLLSSLFFSSFIISRPPARMYVVSERVYGQNDLRPRNRYLFAIFRHTDARNRRYRYYVAETLIIRPARIMREFKQTGINIESLEINCCVEYFNM